MYSQQHLGHVCVCVGTIYNVLMLMLWCARNGRRVQPVEQARPGNESEEEMQLKLALQLSKQQADEEDKIRSVISLADFQDWNPD